MAVYPLFEDNSFDLLFLDPPYYKVKDEWWDKQWDKPAAFLDWLRAHTEQWWRLLKPNGSLYVCASPQMAWAVEGVVRERFNVLNVIRWVKEDGWHKKAEFEQLRQYWPNYETLIFAEHFGVESYAKGEAGYEARCDELRGFVFEPLRAYLDGERRRAGVDFEQVRQVVGCANGSGLPSHWFTRSQWMLPTAENYAKLQKGFNQHGPRPAPPYADYHDAPRNRFEPDGHRNGHEYLRADYEDLRADYEDLRADYEDLRADYEDLRRPFAATPERPYTDVWHYRTVGFFEGKHPAEKPIEMLRDVIQTSSRPGALVGDFFMGRGTTIRAAQELGRQAIGVDVMDHWCKETAARVSDPPLFQLIKRQPKPEQLRLGIG
jgi:site-specific DNA-methyltransferase (adenine-specific)